MTKNQKLNETAEGLLGKALSPLNKELGCVEALSNVFRKAFNEELGENDSTRKLYECLLKDPRFEITLFPPVGCIIISPTGSGNGSIKGHVGIVSDQCILSNNSTSLLWDKHHTITTWKARYEKLGGMPIKFFSLKDDKAKEDPKVELEKIQKSAMEIFIAVLKLKIEQLTKLLTKWQN